MIVYLVDVVIALSQSNSIAKSGEIHGNEKTNPQMILLFRWYKLASWGLPKHTLGTHFNQSVERRVAASIRQNLAKSLQ